MTKKEHDTLSAIARGNPIEIRKRLTDFLATAPITEEPKGTRTSQQNKSIHLWLSLIAAELNNQGQTLQNVVAKITKAEVRPTVDNLKEAVWRPYQIAAVDKESTTQLSKPEVNKVYEGLNKFFGDHFHIHIPFPSDEARHLEGLEGKLGYDHRNSPDYPEYKEPSI